MKDQASRARRLISLHDFRHVSLPLYSEQSTKVDLCPLSSVVLKKGGVKNNTCRAVRYRTNQRIWFGILRVVREENVMLQEKRVKDRRTQRTKNLLHEALGSLIREKPYEAIVVQEILDRANVGRSTFYMHFRDKDELLVSGIHDMLAVDATEL